MPFVFLLKDVAKPSAKAVKKESSTDDSDEESSDDSDEEPPKTQVKVRKFKCKASGFENCRILDIRCYTKMCIIFYICSLLKLQKKAAVKKRTWKMNLLLRMRMHLQRLQRKRHDYSVLVI